MRIIRPDADVTASLSLLLGIYMGKGLFQNYPDNFNELLPQMAKDLVQQISVETEEDQDPPKRVWMIE